MPDGLYGNPQPDLDALDQGADVPISQTDAYGQSFRDNAGDMTRRVLNFVGDHTVRAGAPDLSPDEANAKYGIEGQLRFNTPVTDNDAAFRHGEAVRQGYDAILNERSGANPLVSMGATFAGSLVDPTGLALMAATDGIAGVAKAGLGIGAAADAGSVAARSGLVANTLSGAGRLAGTAAEGAALNL
uniref:hypothetical protein n=1 Tax=Caulobacter sp. S45 TaxID=1641861 RepID=UPI001577097D